MGPASVLSGARARSVNLLHDETVRELAEYMERRGAEATARLLADECMESAWEAGLRPSQFMNGIWLREEGHETDLETWHADALLETLKSYSLPPGRSVELMRKACRLALTGEFDRARDLVVTACRETGLSLIEHEFKEDPEAT